MLMIIVLTLILWLGLKAPFLGAFILAVMIRLTYRVLRFILS